MSSATISGTRSRGSRWADWPLWVMLLPGLLLAVMFKFIPLVRGLVFSFQKVQPFLGNEWVGLANYTEVLQDHDFRDALVHTILLAVGQTIGAVVIGLALALLLEGSGFALWVARTIVVLPVVTAMAVIGEIWRLIYYPASTGFLNSIFGSVGLGPYPWLDSPASALASIMIVGIWAGAPYNMVVFLAGLAGIDRSLYESASVDGASRWRRLVDIVIPGLRGSFVIVLTLSAIRSLGIFTEVYVLTGGGPAGSTHVWMTQVYSQGFDRSNIGLASAASMLLLLVTAGLTTFVQALSRRKAD